jgi:ABC-2 type transport system ATP-binding protein
MLQIDNLTKTYANGVNALKGVNLTISKGMFGLLGPNGAGKSSLMRTLATLQEPDQGQAIFGNIDILKNKYALRQQLGYLPQDFGVYPKISPQEMLDHLAVLKGINNKKHRKLLVAQLLKQVNLFDVKNKSLDTFSGGMKQRFGIAQALIGDPKLIIVDEPTAGLDPTERKRFHDLLSELSEDAIVILSTHIVSDVADLCANMAIMGKGQILKQGATDKVINEMSGNIWRCQVEKKEMTAIAASHNVIRSHLCRGKIEVRVASESQPSEKFSAVNGDLEDVYFATLKANGIETNV